MGVSSAVSSDFKRRVDTDDEFSEASTGVVETSKAAQRTSITRLRETYGKYVLIGAGLQVAIADIVFIKYGTVNNWDLDNSVILGWLSATVVQVIAVALVIARGLFHVEEYPLDDGEAPS